MIVAVTPEAPKGETKSKPARPQLAEKESVPHSLPFPKSGTAQLQQTDDFAHTCENTRGYTPFRSSFSEPAGSSTGKSPTRSPETCNFQTCEPSTVLETRLRLAPFATVNLRHRSLHADSERSPRYPRLPGVQNPTPRAHRLGQRTTMPNLPPHLPDPRRNSRFDHRPGHQSSRLIALQQKSPGFAKNHAYFAH